MYILQRNKIGSKVCTHTVTQEHACAYNTKSEYVRLSASDVKRDLGRGERDGRCACADFQ